MSTFKEKSPLDKVPFWHTCIINPKQNSSLAPLLKVTRAFLEIIKEIGLVELYYIELEKFSIKVSMKTRKSARLKVVEEWRKFSLSTDLSAIPSTTFEYHQGFPGNKTTENPVEFFFIEELSALTLKVLGEENIIDDMILLYSLYLHLGWIKIRSMICDETISTVLVKGYCWFNRDDLEEGLKKRIENLYSENKSFIMELYGTVMSKDLKQLQCLPYWMKTWFEMCIERLNNNKMLYFNEDHLNEISYFLIPDLINKHLGMSKEARLTQVYYINKVAMDMAIQISR